MSSTKKQNPKLFVLFNANKSLATFLKGWTSL